MKMEEKKAKILNAAEDVFSKKGLAEATISEIASKAGIADSVIYQYFKGKEDLLFSIPSQKKEGFLSSLHEHLQGISDPESRLSKLIWYYLKSNDTEPGHTRILMLECLSLKDFYKSPAHEIIRQYAKMLSDILRQGIDEGAFDPDLDLSLVRDILLGLLGCETTTCLAVGEIDESVPDLEDIMSLTHAMIRRRKETRLSKPDRILLAAEWVFAEKGITKAKISEIAKLARVAEGTVYEYFANKEDLLLSIPVKRFTQFLNEQPELFKIRSPLKKLRRFIGYFFSLFSREPNFLKVFLLQIQLHKRFYKSKSFESFWSYFKIIEQIINEGKADGSIREDVNPRVFRNMLIGTFNNLALRWFILDRDRNTDKMRKIDQVTDLLLSALSNEEKI